MAASFHILALTIIIILSKIPLSSSSSSSSLRHGLSRGSSLYAENKDDFLVSPNGVFTAGFHQVGDNAYAFSVWFTEKSTSESRTQLQLVWMANRDAPVNGKRSKLSLWKDGNLVLTDAGQYIIWSTQTESASSSSMQLQLHNTGNLVLQQQLALAGKINILWQSFDYPTDTLLPNQPLTKNAPLVSSRSRYNHSSGFYKLFFDYDGILRLLYNGPETTSIYWPDPRAPILWRAGRFEYIDSRRATLDSNGEFNSSDGFGFLSADFGSGSQRFMRIDTDGNVRVYTLQTGGTNWKVQWQAISHPCRINGACGPNSLCTYSTESGRKCTCLHGYKMVNSQDWSYGCKPQFKMCRGSDDCDFIKLRYVEFYGYDIGMLLNGSLDACKKGCLQNGNCIGFNYGWKPDKGYYYCFFKSSLNNGYQNGVIALMYIKLPKTIVSSFDKQIVSDTRFSCRRPAVVTPLIRSYKKMHDSSKPFRFLILFGCIVGFIEIICILFFWYFSSERSPTTEEMYFPASTGFRKFTYSELKKATRNFREEIGRGGGSVVYKARLKDNRIAAIKRLKNTNHQGEAEFQAEISTIGRVNHMNLIETWGYCAEGKHRLVVYEYMEKGSLAQNSGIGWATRFDIAVGTAKGLAYLHEECLEWVLHCDVKPHNILLDANYNPKVSDFGLSKWSDRDRGADQWNFSEMRGTRGYMAPEWVLNLPITSKVDVFSYGVVMLEMITGRTPISNENGESLIHWVRNRNQNHNQNPAQTESWVEEIIDPTIKGEYDARMMENLVRVALQCTQEDREARPTMSQVVNMLLGA